MTDCLTQYYRCPGHYFRLALKGPLSATRGYFRLGDATLYGNYCGRELSSVPGADLVDASRDTRIEEGVMYLPFDLEQVIDNLRCERYVDTRQNGGGMTALARTYYLARPLLPFALRSYLKKLHLNGWEKMSFPRWPVDCSVENLTAQLLQFAVRSKGAGKIPFIWFWPEGAPSCAIMTHDVETQSGYDFCSTMMDVDDSFGIKASFQIVPEERYGVSAAFLNSIRDRGFEVAIHDLNHDGHLYKDREQFLRRAAKINAYGEQYGAEGFRAAVLYRKQQWYDALQFSYDMSVPNVAHLDPQQGGCCTVMPYFIGNILELPVTTTQDYMLFHILNDYSIDLWKQQTELIMEKHGFMNFIVHPDYITELEERKTYETLLSYLSQLRSERNVWIPLPREVDQWWRQRSQMRIVREGNGWRIEGSGHERAQLAYASERNGKIEYMIDSRSEVRSGLSEKRVLPPS